MEGMKAKIARIYQNIAARQWFCFLAGSALSVVIWKFSSTALQDIIVFSAFLYALFFADRGYFAWRQPAGIAFVILLIHHLIMLPFSLSPPMSIGDTERFFEVLAGAFAIPVIFNNDRKISRAIFYSATGIAMTLAYDLGRMAYFLGPDILAKAHSFRPFILNHSNVASMMAGMAFYVFFFFILAHLSRPGAAHKFGWPLPAYAAAAMICLAYLVIAASRGPQIAFVLAFACVGFVLPGRRNKLIFFLLVLALGASLFFTHQRINPRFAERKTMVNFSERDIVWKQTWKLVQERPWFGHGYGKRNFEMNYYASQPPRASYHFPHCHHYWLKLLFEYGWTGTFLCLAAWLLLAFGLARRIAAEHAFSQRVLPASLAIMLLFIHLYGLGDYPDNIVQTAQVWLIPAALVVIAGGKAAAEG